MKHPLGVWESHLETIHPGWSWLLVSPLVFSMEICQASAAVLDSGSIASLDWPPARRCWHSPCHAATLDVPSRQRPELPTSKSWAANGELTQEVEHIGKLTWLRQNLTSMAKPSFCLNWFSSKLLVNSLGARCFAMARSKMLSAQLQVAPHLMASMASLLWRMVGSKASCSMASNCHNTCGQVPPAPGPTPRLEVKYVYRRWH